MSFTYFVTFVKGSCSPIESLPKNKFTEHMNENYLSISERMSGLLDIPSSFLCVSDVKKIDIEYEKCELTVK